LDIWKVIRRNSTTGLNPNPQRYFAEYSQVSSMIPISCPLRRKKKDQPHVWKNNQVLEKILQMGQQETEERLTHSPLQNMDPGEYFTCHILMHFTPRLHHPRLHCHWPHPHHHPSPRSVLLHLSTPFPMEDLRGAVSIQDDQEAKMGELHAAVRKVQSVLKADLVYIRWLKVSD
jgi:hypothetical protein